MLKATLVRKGILPALATAAIVAGTAAAAPPPSSTVTVHPGSAIQIAIPEALTSAGFGGLGESGIRAVRMAFEGRTVKGFPVALNVFDTPCRFPEDTQAEFDAKVKANQAIADQIVANPETAAVLGYTCSFAMVFTLPTYESAAIPVMTAEASSESLPPLGPTVFNRVIVAEPETDSWYSTVTKLPADVAWQRQYEARWGEPPAYGADLHYDAANLLLDRLDAVATIKGGNLVIDRAALGAAIRRTTNFAGVSCTITIGADGNRISDRKALKACANGNGH